MATVSACSTAHASESSQLFNEEHNAWNPDLGFLVCAVITALARTSSRSLLNGKFGRVALLCRFALDLCCDKGDKQTSYLRRSWPMTYFFHAPS